MHRRFVCAPLIAAALALPLLAAAAPFGFFGAATPITEEEDCLDDCSCQAESKIDQADVTGDGNVIVEFPSSGPTLQDGCCEGAASGCRTRYCGWKYQPGQLLRFRTTSGIAGSTAEMCVQLSPGVFSHCQPTTSNYGPYSELYTLCGGMIDYTVVARNAAGAVIGTASVGFTCTACIGDQG